MAVDLRQVFLAGKNAFGKVGVISRVSHIARVRRDVVGNSGLGSHHRSVADGEMSCHAHLACQIYVISQDRAASQAYLSAEDAVSPDLAIMAHLDQIVQLAARTDHGRAKRCPVDRGVGADFHIILNHHLPDLGNLLLLAVQEQEAKAVRADHHSAVDDDPAADHAVLIDSHLRVKPAGLAHTHVVFDLAAIADHAAGSYFHVFADPGLARQISTGGTAIQHEVFRLGAAGVVEVWPPEIPEVVPAVETWAPLDEQPVALPVARLAGRIAEPVRDWLDRGEILQSEGRPIRAGDILILVRRRRPFATTVVAALKARNIAVAGADRIRLADQIAMQDLLALGDFLLLPEDDLALATVLKSPLFDLDDDDLMRIAPGRPRALWSALIRAANEQPKFAEAVALLKRWRARADLLPPFEFFAEILDRDGMRGRLLARLGPEAGDPIDEFLRLAISYDEGEPPSLQGFIAAIRASDREIKRDMEHGRDEVRVMTVHGAKGLEAPIVFLPDTCSNSSGGRPGGFCLLYTSPSPRDRTRSRMPSSA